MFRDISGLECRNCVHIEVILDFLPGTNRLLLYIARTIVCQTVCPFWCHNLEFYWENIIITTKKMLKEHKDVDHWEETLRGSWARGSLGAPLKFTYSKVTSPPPTENKTKLILRTPPPPGKFSESAHGTVAYRWEWSGSVRHHLLTASWTLRSEMLQQNI